VSAKLTAAAVRPARAYTHWPPISNFLQRLIAICILYLHSLHSRRRVTFLVVLACRTGRKSQEEERREQREDGAMVWHLFEPKEAP
jgi:hypothetical protein